MPVVLFIPLVLIVILLGLGVLALIVSSFRRGTANRGGSNREDPTRQLERTWTLLGRMEDRIANLETILIERSRPAAAESKEDSTYHA